MTRSRRIAMGAALLLVDGALVLLLMTHVRASERADTADDRPVALRDDDIVSANPDAPDDVIEGADAASDPSAAPGAPTPPDVPTWLPDRERCSEHLGRPFCDGPRRALAPSGTAARFVARLGLGTDEAAARILRSGPRPGWVGIAGSGAPRALSWPVVGGTFGRGVGFTRDDDPESPHLGVDIGAGQGAPVHAVAAGIVAYADNGIRGYGNLLIVLHGGNAASAYAHLSIIHVYPGQRVARDQHIANVGATGLARGPHLHFEWREGSDVVNPMPLFVDAPR